MSGTVTRRGATGAGFSSRGWIGVDLDGTAAEYDKWISAGHIGKPIPKMIERMKRWLAEGRDVRWFTARAFTLEGDPVSTAIAAIWQFSQDNLGQQIPITNRKDMHMIELWDDRCVQVIANTGETVGESTRGLA